MNFSMRDSQCRVDRFKLSGKWYDTFEIDMQFYWHDPDIYKAVETAIKRCNGQLWGEDWVYVCLEPYHKNAFPIMLKGD